MKGPRLPFEQRYQIWGWVLFIASALFYGAASIRTGDLLGALGSLFFLVACIVFLIPFFFPGRSG
ncbi:MAG: cytochrome oxidase subunit III [Deltaproteobacteria bacterium]|nr:cytochrome oxidase subunit III [Deltaproteobacteria bacterium]